MKTKLAWFGPQYLLLLVTLAFLLFGAGCSGEQREKPIGEGYISSANPALRDRLGPGATIIGTLKAGERVEILQKRRRWVRVRTAAKQEGWLDERHIIPLEVYQRSQQLVRSTAGRPTQGLARARSLVNLHLEPARGSPALFQLQEGESCDVLEHRAVERPLLPGVAQPSGPQPGGPPVAQPAAGAQMAGQAGKSKAKPGKRAPPAGPKMDDWYLVRGKEKAGWALARMIEMAMPDEVAQHAEGKVITAWQVLNEVQSRGERKAQYVWATSTQVGSPYDFDGIRVFTWDPLRKRYGTAYHESNLRGVYPLTVGRVMLQGGEVPSFNVTTLDKSGKPVTRHFVFLGNRVRRLEQVQQRIVKGR